MFVIGSFSVSASRTAGHQAAQPQWLIRVTVIPSLSMGPPHFVPQLASQGDAPVKRRCRHGPVSRAAPETSTDEFAASR
jgi:hypothetical protein